jgi:hypothetical protein
VKAGERPRRKSDNGYRISVTRSTGEHQLYDEARGPRDPKRLTRRRCADEWDDPTWLAVAVDHAWLEQAEVRQ